ncbi:cobalamin biosynthesis protein CobW [Clostridium botulinum]|uniref:Cobalamin biosynthesis protein n=1 Tax=Clostridium botulinum (strain Hall / ATCC 3502 / NCTC 13319 / Type A) TaxID=441771 RepID=A5I1X0_CLOBH|nr:GTP-binding protein [Clostridium botulinum]ABS33079.1 CobW/P47K family protein [Clostridium botulinum A str. ATCC 19397]ABS36873.1 CobW/P47K family protein [Clostridium botulinum A str. Hall]APH22129.1 type II/IV secretion system family protein [Clostridium botulinum]APQ67824.1 type II/IV secretion system family protein [Clostridium botulinum]APQ73881.1 type II/IV secretion system family protein [Clostridium botulinum]
MIKVNLISGFLGAGKTTLIKKVLENVKEEKIVIIENEFGEVAIDGDLIKKEGFDVFELRSGCICCMMKQDFEDSLQKVIEEYKPDRIIIEPTGISSLSQLLDILEKDNFKDKININRVITVVDSTSYLEEKDAFGEFYMDQVENAEILIVSKTQMVDKSTLKKVKESLRECNKKASIKTLAFEEFNKEYILNFLDEDSSRDIKRDSVEVMISTEDGFESLGVKTNKIFEIREINEIVSKLFTGKYGDVIRIKGFLKGEKEIIQINCTKKVHNIETVEDSKEIKICIIGQDLRKRKIQFLFKEKYNIKKL